MTGGDDIRGTGIYRSDLPFDKKMMVAVLIVVTIIGGIAWWKACDERPILHDVFVLSANQVVGDTRLAVAVEPEDQQRAVGESYTVTIFVLNLTNELVQTRAQALLASSSEYTTGSLTVDGQQVQVSVHLAEGGSYWILDFAELVWVPGELHVIRYEAVLGGPGALVPWGCVSDTRF